MRSRIFFAVLAVLAISFLPLRPAQAEDKSSVLARLDAAAKAFHTATADFKFESIQTDPVPDTDTRSGVTYFERKGDRFAWGAHVQKHDNRPAGSIYILSGGSLRVSDSGKEKDAKDYSQYGKYESYFALGFGASGKDLADKWDITYLGKEKIGDIETDKLELVAKDPKVRNSIHKVTVWMDTARAVSLKLVFDEGQGQSLVCTYTHVKLNQPLPAAAFDFDK